MQLGQPHLRLRNLQRTATRPTAPNSKANQLSSTFAPSPTGAEQLATPGLAGVVVAGAGVSAGAALGTGVGLSEVVSLRVGATAVGVEPETAIVALDVVVADASVGPVTGMGVGAVS